MTSDASADPDPLDWTAARDTTARHRRRRLHPDPRAGRRSRRLGTAAVVLWTAAALVVAAAIITPGSAGSVLALVGYGILFGYAAVAFLWATGSGRYLLRGDDSSIRRALPSGAWPLVRHQLAGRLPIEAEHGEVIVELAYQQRRLVEGQLVFGGFYTVLCLSVAYSNHGWLRSGLLILLVALLVWGLIAGITAHRRMDRVIDADAA